MNENKNISYALVIVAGIIIVWLILNNMEKDKRISELERKNREKDNLNKKLHEKIEELNEIPVEVKEQLEQLINQYQNIDPNVTHELMAASSLIEIKEHIKAIGVLTKIIENLLKDKYSTDDSLLEKVKKKGKKRPVLADYIEHARDNGLISSEEYHFANGLRELRNEDAHVLNPQKSKILTSSAFLSAVDLILKISHVKH